MCTVSVIPSSERLLLGMNRDEQRTRVVGVFSGVRQIEGVAVVGPTEPSGGTWAVANAFGCVFALLNWYAKPVPDRGNSTSRGTLVSSVANSPGLGEVSKRFQRLRLFCFRPFRLVGVSTLKRRIVEWRWDGEALQTLNHDWEPQCWASSGFDEPAAQAARLRLFKQQSWQTESDNTELLRDFHRGHEPKPGALSVCMHREEAATVSYSEFKVADGIVEASYISGAPCAETLIRRAELTIQKGSWV